MKNSLSILFALMSLVFVIGQAQSSKLDSTQSEQSIKEIDFYPTVLGDTSSLSVPPPDFVDYSVEPKAILKVNPEYPKEALGDKLEGIAFLKCWVTTTGVVRRAKVIRSDSKYFNRPALVAALQWKFEPAKYSDGKLVDVWVSIPFRSRVR